MQNICVVAKENKEPQKSQKFLLVEKSIAMAIIIIIC